MFAATIPWFEFPTDNFAIVHIRPDEHFKYVKIE